MTDLLLASGLLASLLYWAIVTRPVSVWRTATKGAALGLPLIALALMGWPWLALLGLALSVLGDLALSRAGDSALKAGIGFFALAHIAYVAAIYEHAPLEPTTPALAAIAALWLFGLSTRFWLLPHTGPLRPAVALHVVLILAMGVMALLSAPPSPWLIGGALAFIASDLILSIEIFRLGDSPWKRLTALLVWPLYIAGQAGIMMGLAPAI
ncbi:MAG: lysoplasmalogenase [Rhodobacteraceae bacterium]|nr:lysoplasmalogenase [Paracoccaceae bacterium]